MGILERQGLVPLTVQDETAHLVLPGMVIALWPGTRPLPSTEAIQASGTQIEVASAQQVARFQVGDRLVLGAPETGEMVRVTGINRNLITLSWPLKKAQTRVTVAVAGLARFAWPRTWLRARLQSDGEPASITLNGLFLNAVWAAQVRTFENEPLGRAMAGPIRSFSCRQTPVLKGEIIEVRELSGPRAAVELPMLQEELLAQGLTSTDIRTVTDRRTGRLPRCGCAGCPVPTCFSLARITGITWWSAVAAASSLAITSTDAFLLPETTTSAPGNTAPAARSIRQCACRSHQPAPDGVVAEGVSNPRPAEGGADGEPVALAHTRGPQVVRHRQQAISLSDYEALAREASPAVAVARALPITHASGRTEPGWVKVDHHAAQPGTPTTTLVWPAATDYPIFKRLRARRTEWTTVRHRAGLPARRSRGGHHPA